VKEKYKGGFVGGGIKTDLQPSKSSQKQPSCFA